MKGLKIIPVFVVLLACSYVGILFIEGNREQVSISLGSSQTPPAALGLVVLTSILIGMIIAGALCSLELLVLLMQNRQLKKKVPSSSSSVAKPASPATTSTRPTLTERFSSGKKDEEENDETTEREAAPKNRFTPL